MECYVCTEPAFTLSPCKCKNLYLHENCYAKLLAYNNKRCGVCLQDYPLPDLESPAVYIEKEDEERDELIRHNMFIPILLRDHAIAKNLCDGLMEPIRHIVIICLFFMAMKAIFDSEAFSDNSFFNSNDINFLFFSILLDSMFIFFIRSLSNKYRHNRN